MMRYQWVVVLFALIVVLVSVAPRGVHSDTTECCHSNGTCGPDQCGFGCITGPCEGSCFDGVCKDKSLCCSQWGWCNLGYDSCGPKCQSGPCYNVTLPPTPTPSPTPGPTVDPDPGNCKTTHICPEPILYCCSQWNYCGTNSTFCGVGCQSGPCLLTSHTVLYDTSIVIGLGIVVAIGAVLAISAALVLAFRKDHFARQGPFYCGIIIIGVLVGYIAAFLALLKQTDALCLAFPWFLGVAFVLVYGCLFIKTWVIYGMFRRAARLKRVDVAPFYILKLLLVFLAIEVIFLAVWSTVDPPKAYHAHSDIFTPFEIQCRTKSNTFWLVFLFVKGAWLLFGGALCFLMRKVSKEYNKSKAIAYSIYNNVVIILLAGSLGAVLKNETYALVVVKVIGIVCSFTFTLFILNFSVWYKIFYAKFDIVAGMLKMRADSTSTNTTAARTTSYNSNDSPSGTYDDSTRSKEARYSQDTSPPA